MVLTGEGSDENFGGYEFLLLDYLRQDDAAAEHLNLATPPQSYRDCILHRIEDSPPAQDHLSISNFSFSDAKAARAMLGGISMHRIHACMGASGEIYHPMLLKTIGEPDIAGAVAENFDGRVRQNARSGRWHSLNTALVTHFFFRGFYSC